ncbi:MAG: dinitrogenase iron-molybdenum cofactor biosynthesis protein [Desulfovibrio sp.]|nr:dinitrogenase iron-molybdenum cofactor biosynthesis protein [Desulfovibrio sp.]
MSVVAISSEGPTLSDAVDPRFGRAGGFVIARYSGDEDAEISYLDNGEAQMLPQGAGIKTAENLSEAGVDTVLSGYVGPKAEEALLAAEIRVVQNMDGTSVGEALKKWRQMERDSSPA